MLKESTVIKQIPDGQAEATGLAKYNRSRMPRCFDKLSPAQNRDGRFITGIDEDSLEINIIQDKELQAQRKSDIKALRLSLESLTGNDLSGTSDFWKSYYVILDSDRDLPLNHKNPHDVIKFAVLTANGYVAPSFEDTSNYKYKDAKYYAHFQVKADEVNVSTKKLRDKARAELLKMEDKKQTMLLIGKTLEGIKYTNKLDKDTIYSFLSDYIDRSKENVENFLKAAATNTEELQIKALIDLALRLKKIKFKDGYYQRGQVTLGTSLEELYSNMKTPSFAAELESIQKELEGRD